MQSYGRPVTQDRLCAALAVLFSLLSLDCAGADTEEPPGTLLGTFHATALLTDSNCGAGIEAPDKHELQFVLSQDDTAIYWTQSGITLVGSLDDDEATWTYQAPGQTDGTCRIDQQQIFEATLDDVESPDTLRGTIRLEVSPISGSNCSGQTTATGGTFDNLPCSAGYVFSAKKE
jgi:hypothetical protein